MLEEPRHPRTVRMTDELWAAAQHAASAAGYPDTGAWIRELIEREIAGSDGGDDREMQRLSHLILRAVLQVWHAQQMTLSEEQVHMIRLQVKEQLVRLGVGTPGVSDGNQ